MKYLKVNSIRRWKKGFGNNKIDTIDFNIGNIQFGIILPISSTKDIFYIHQSLYGYSDRNYVKEVFGNNPKECKLHEIKDCVKQIVEYVNKKKT